MATVKVEIPDFEFTGFYYPEILQDLIQFNRVNVPEITDESPEEPFIQFLRSFALGTHLNNVLLDLVAKERFLATASLRASVAAHLELIDVKLAQASPATSDIIIELSQSFTAAQVIVPATTKFATLSAPGADAIDYEALAQFSTARTDQVSKVLAYDADLDSWTDHTAEAISPSGNFAPGWGAAPAPGDILYIGHTDVLWDKLNIVLPFTVTGITAGVWEFYDGELDYTVPDSVVNNGTTLTFILNLFLGALNRTGTLIRVKSNITGGFEDLVSTWDGVNNSVTTVAFLGQTTPSTAQADYLIGSAWKPLHQIVDPSNMLQSAGSMDITYEVPQTITEKWAKVAVGSIALSTTANWLRFRVIAVAAPGMPQITQIRIDTGKQFALVEVTQGTSQSDAPLASSTGLPDQSFQLARNPVLDDATIIVYVTESIEEPWTRVDNFLNSTAVDKHYRIEYDDDGRATIIFSDGVTGKIPASGTNNIRCTYRTMVDVDGNVGQNTINVNKGGIAFVNRITNPRAANGYRTREGSTPEDLARVKIAGPASLRTKDRAVTVPDVEVLAGAFVNASGARPIGRALAIEESFGPKTVEVVVVGGGGGAVSIDDRTQLTTYFNGDATTKVSGKLLMNHAVTVSNFVPKVVSVTATVYGGNLSTIKTALAALLSPVALSEDGVTFAWDFGTEVPLSRINAEIMNTEPKPRKTVITLPVTDVPLAAKELPTVGTLLITVLP